MDIKVIKPREITGKILTLIEESTNEVIIVSPYINISRWTKVKQALTRAKKRGVRIIVYLRGDQANSAYMIEPFADAFYLVDMLHAKLYLNSNSAVFTSMNLVQASDEKSTDLGIYTTDQSILKSFEEFIDTYLHPVAYEPNQQSIQDVQHQQPEISSVDFLTKLGEELQNVSPNGKWTRAKNYWFSGYAAPNGDLMVSENFVWKLHKDQADTASDIEWFTQIINEHFGKEVSITLDNEHVKYTYLDVQIKNGNNIIEIMTELLKILRSK